MEAQKGSDRGSYIWGRSVHNTRIERLWYDVTNGFGRKWKVFFMDLEANHGLNPTNQAHIWLLHYLFLSSVMHDALEWAEAWNAHKLQVKRQRQRSPRDMFFFGMLQEGPRGFSAFMPSGDIELNPLDISSYGVDWDVMDDPVLMAHHLTHNPHEWEDENPFVPATTPVNLSEVVCDPPNCPFSPEQMIMFTSMLHLSTDSTSRNMNVRRLVWLEALHICREIFMTNM
ncbi:hypothetical protein B0H21DRAFT_690181 [Amylocystis lapponica]|nr:hypothetical protein B0H21DRAFT_690181 [Amylocystis lapponica]